MGFPERLTNYGEEVDGKVEEEKTDYKTLCNRSTTCQVLNKGVYFYPLYNSKKFKPVMFNATRSWNKTLLK